MLPFVSGLNTGQQSCINQRYAILCAFFRHHLAKDPSWREHLLLPENHQQLLPLFAELERFVVQRDFHDVTNVANGFQAFRQAYYLPLADSLELYLCAEDAALGRCREYGYFDPPNTQPARIDIRQPHDITPVRPYKREVFANVRALIRRLPDIEQRAGALVREGICRNLGNARAVVAFFRRSTSKTDKKTLQKCWDLGLFNKLPTQSPLRPDPKDLFPKVHAVLSHVADIEEQIAALVQEELCPNWATAEAVVTTCTEKGAKLDRAFLRRCWHQGLFDRLPAPAKTISSAARPSVDDLTDRVRAILAEQQEHRWRVGALIDAGICRDHVVARRVLAALDRRDPNSLLNKIAASLARQIAYAYLTVGPHGLLYTSGYALVDVLVRLEREVAKVAEWRGRSDLPIVTLRHDFVALYNAFQSVAPELWKPDLLFAPEVSDNRRRYQQLLPTERLADVIATLRDQRQCDETEATILCNLLLQQGMPVVIDWRFGIDPAAAGQAIEQRRLQHVLEHHLAALDPAARQEIARLLRCLQVAIQETEVTLSLSRVLNEHPYSAYWKRLKRRLPVSFGVIQHFRRQRSRQRSRGVGRTGKGYRRVRRESMSPVVVAAARLVAAFAAQAGLEEEDAARRLWGVCTYGGIGFIPKDEWVDLIDSRLLALLKFYKFGRIEGRLILAQALPQVNTYARMLGRAELSSQLAQALLSTQIKPRRWNSGEGEKVAAVRKRAGLVLPGKPWLHRVWRIFLLDLPLSIAASQYSAASDVCYLLLVIDLGSQLPLACWASASQPTIREVKLALFQSVWHPGALDWPLRGIPEILQVPASLVSTDSNQLHEAAWWLVARVQIVDDATQDKILARLSETTAIVQDLFFVGLDEIRQIANSRLMTVKDVQDAVTTWLRKSEKCFAAHRPGLQDTARKQGFALPAFDSPAAGLLLPVGETGVMTLRDGVLADDKFFTAPDFHSAPQQTLHYRAYPYRYDGARPDERMDEAIFLVHPDGALQYLVRQS